MSGASPGLARGALALAALTVVGCGDPAPTRVEWPAYGGPVGGTKYLRSDQLSADNVAGLRVAWRWASAARQWKRQLARSVAAGDRPPYPVSPKLSVEDFECTPLMVGGVLYGVTPIGQVFALDARTGEQRWLYDPESYRAATRILDFHMPKHRGVAWWSDGNDSRVLVTTIDAYLLALDARTGESIEGFGDRGRVDLLDGLRAPEVRRLRDYFQSSPPAVHADVAIVGGSVHDRPESRRGIPGDVRAYDVRTGALRWTFHVVPAAGEPGRDTWAEESWRFGGASNAWGLMTVDHESGAVFVPTSAPTNDLYGGERVGDNLYSNSLLALDAGTGELRWHQQLIRHGLWDYDLAAPPVLLDVEVGGARRSVVAQVTKQGYTFVFDRDTGEPLWPLEEVEVPASDVPGERAARTQPIPTRPPPFEERRATEEHLIDFTPGLRQQALEVFRRYRSGPLFTPPSLEGTITLPGSSGGANWHGAAADPETGWLYVHSIQSAMLQAVRPAESDTGFAYEARSLAPLYVPGGTWSDRALPLFQPPYSRLTAIDLNAREFAGGQRMAMALEITPRSRDSTCRRSVQVPMPARW